MTPLVSMVGVTKRFGPITAVEDVSLSLMPGRVHALMGENGAGKSTLMKVLAGVLKPTEGKIEIGSQPVRFDDPRQALAAGISTVFQELSLLPNLSIAENMFLGKELTGRFGGLDQREMHRRTRDALNELGMTLDPDTLVSELSISERQFVEIARGIKADAQVFVLDEPTAALNAADVEILNQQIQKLTDAGKAVVYISHRMDEIFQVCDDVTVMKDGKLVATHNLKDLTPDSLIALMVGRELQDLFPPGSDQIGKSCLSCRNLVLTPDADPISFDLHKGEILGLSGLEGQGQQEIARSLLGQHAPLSGELRINEHALSLPIPKSSGVRKLQSLRVGFVPEDRKEEGLLLSAPIRENIGISLQAARPGYRFVAKLASLVDKTMQNLNVKAPNSAVPVASLSGGNQQKVLLGRYLAADMDILIIEEPTRGVDIGAKAEIYRLLRALANQGKAILVLSRETIELIGLCDRLLVIHDQKIAKEMPAATATEHAILDAALNS
ncbi:sugar ABC transporter ATP-binding protein [Shimia sp.]|uniref:sugar ABC transporter ATP-binding protein n=1 Tax=Shimia sp. TaxID=1954381 RepID=UPI003299FEB9